MTTPTYELYERKPFHIRATQITDENIEELAPLIGELVRSEDSVPYIVADRRKCPNIHRAYIGYWVSHYTGENGPKREKVRCWSDEVFKKQFDKVT